MVGTLAANIEAAIARRKPDLVSLDPFVKSHSAEENNNTVIDEVAQILTDLGSKHNIGADAPHHVSKGAADPGNGRQGSWCQRDGGCGQISQDTNANEHRRGEVVWHKGRGSQAVHPGGQRKGEPGPIRPAWHSGLS
jgi:hypothetical protein